MTFSVNATTLALRRLSSWKAECEPLRGFSSWGAFNCSNCGLQWCQHQLALQRRETNIRGVSDLGGIRASGVWCVGHDGWGIWCCRCSRCEVEGRMFARGRDRLRVATASLLHSCLAPSARTACLYGKNHPRATRKRATLDTGSSPSKPCPT